MAVFDDVIEDVAGRFDLGAKAGPLMREVLQLVTGSPGGIGGFIDKLKSAGFGSQIASWLGKTDGTVLTPPQVQTALGGSVLSGIANRVGITGNVAGTAIGYLLPKVIGQLTPGNTSFLNSPRVRFDGVNSKTPLFAQARLRDRLAFWRLRCGFHEGVPTSTQWRATLFRCDSSRSPVCPSRAHARA